MVSIKQLSPEDRPRERLEREGVHSLSNSELMAILLSSGTKNENAITVAYELLGKEGIANMAGLSLKRLSKHKGIGKAKACRIIAAFELGKRCFASQLDGEFIRNAEDAVKMATPSLREQNKEVFIGLYVGTKNRLLKKEVISIGSLDKSIVHPREVFKPAIEEMSAGVVVLHNHPSGDPVPSEEDIETTRELKKAGELLGIPLLDHIIVGKNRYISMRELEII